MHRGHLRRLAQRGHIRCTNRQRQNACTGRIVLARPQTGRMALSTFICNPPSFRCRGAFRSANDPLSAMEGKQRYYCSNDEEQQPEPEYLEIVMDTADKMRSAVRNYVAQYSNEQHNNNEYKTGSITQSESTCNQNPAPIKLVGILATNTTHPVTTGESCDIYENDTYGNERYSEQIAASCFNDGIIYEPWRVPLTIEALERAIHHANERLDVHGILVFYPVSDRLTDDTTTVDTATSGSGRRRTYKCQDTGVYYRSMDDYFRDLVACHKDVEGYCRKGLRIQQPSSENDKEDNDDSTSSEHIVKAEELGPIYPCTALAVYKIIESLSSSSPPNHKYARERMQFENTTMTIINRSEVLGLPLATMLSNQGATVYSINIDSILQFLPNNGKVQRMHPNTTMEDCVRKSSVIVSGVPSNTFQVPTEWIPLNATVINVAAESNFDEETIESAEGVTYVPHVGRVTVAALEHNLMKLHKNYHVK